ncbi:hypothetical protein ACFSNO_28190 [Streptomyces cirratus]
MQLVRVGVLARHGHHVRDELLLAGGVRQHDDRRAADLRQAQQLASISPGSMRKPRIFTCWSARPR